jgi:uncharacterized protein (TIRG00374 family)
MSGTDKATTFRAGGGRRRFGWRGLLQVAIGVGALALVISRSDARALAEAIKQTRMAYLPLAVLASLAVTWLMSYRWGVILSTRGHRVGTARLFAYYLIGGFFTNFAPGGGVSGDVARLVYVDRDVRDKAFVLSTLACERVIGLFTLLLTGLVALLASRASLAAGGLFYAGEALLALAVVGAAALTSDYASARLARLCRAAGRRFRLERFGEAAARVFEAMSELRRFKGMIAATFLLSVAVRVVWGLGCYVVAFAMGLPLGLPIVFAFISLVDVIRLMPISVGGLGVREWAVVVLFAKVGIGQEQALMFSFLAFAPVMLNAVVGGLLYISRAGLGRKDRAVAERAPEGIKT